MLRALFGRRYPSLFDLQIDSRLLAILAGFQLIGNFLVFLQAVEPRTLHRADMHEYIIALFVRLDKAVALGGVEPFNCAAAHLFSPSEQGLGKQPYFSEVKENCIPGHNRHDLRLALHMKAPLSSDFILFWQEK